MTNPSPAATSRVFLRRGTWIEELEWLPVPGSECPALQKPVLVRLADETIWLGWVVRFDQGRDDPTPVWVRDGDHPNVVEPTHFAFVTGPPTLPNQTPTNRNS